MSTKILILIVVAGIIVASTYTFLRTSATRMATEVEKDIIAVPAESTSNLPASTNTLTTVTLTGTYVCLPTLSGVATADCAFGIKTDDDLYYAVNFGAAAGSMADFRAEERISAEGTLIPADELIPNHWVEFNSRGLFTILKKL